MPRPSNEISNIVGQALTGGALATIGYFADDAKAAETIVRPLIGFLAGVEGGVLLGEANKYADSKDPQKSLTNLNNLSNLLIMAGVGAGLTTAGAAAAPVLFTAAFAIRTFIPLRHACNDPTNRTYHLLDAAVSAAQATGIGVGLVGKVKTFGSLMTSAGFSAFGTAKSLFFACKKPVQDEEQRLLPSGEVSDKGSLTPTRSIPTHTNV